MQKTNQILPTFRNFPRPMRQGVPPTSRLLRQGAFFRSDKLLASKGLNDFAGQPGGIFLRCWA